MSIDLWSLPAELLFLVTNKLDFHELCRLRKTCRSFDFFVEERRHHYTIHTKFELTFNFDKIPYGSRIQDMEQGEVVVSLPSNVKIYVADPYSQLSAVDFDYIRINTNDSPMKSEKLMFPAGKLYESIDRLTRKKDEADVLRVIDLDTVNLLSRMRLCCKNFHFIPNYKEENPWLYLSSVAFRNLFFGINNSEDPNILTVQDLKRLATTTKCQKVFAKFSYITEEVFNAFGAFSHVGIEMSYGETRGSTSWLHDYIEKLLAGETCGRLKELYVDLDVEMRRNVESIISDSWTSNPNFVELFKEEEMTIYLMILPNNQFAYFCETLVDEATTNLHIALLNLDDLWTPLQNIPGCLYWNRPLDFSSLVGNSLEQTIEKYQTFFHYASFG